MSEGTVSREPKVVNQSEVNTMVHPVEAHPAERPLVMIKAIAEIDRIAISELAGLGEDLDLFLADESVRLANAGSEGIEDNIAKAEARLEERTANSRLLEELTTLKVFSGNILTAIRVLRARLDI